MSTTPENFYPSWNRVTWKLISFVHDGFAWNCPKLIILRSTWTQEGHYRVQNGHRVLSCFGNVMGKREDVMRHKRELEKEESEGGWSLKTR